MSITGIASASSAGYFQQLQSVPQTSAPTQATTAQTAAATRAARPVSVGSTQQAGQVQHHHHNDNTSGAAAETCDLAQSDTASADGTNILNTLA